jgi:hypothetical protein
MKTKQMELSYLSKPSQDVSHITTEIKIVSRPSDFDIGSKEEDTLIRFRDFGNNYNLQNQLNNTGKFSRMSNLQQNKTLESANKSTQRTINFANLDQDTMTPKHESKDNNQAQLLQPQ